VAADPTNSVLSIFNHIVQQHGSDFAGSLAQIINSNDHLRSRVRSPMDHIFPMFSPQSAGTSDSRRDATIRGINAIPELLMRLVSTVKSGGEASQDPLDTLMQGLRPYEVPDNSNDAIVRLGSLLSMYGSDKSVGHSYHLVYGSLFPNPSQVSRILEIGLGTNHLDVMSTMGPDGKRGASLRAFRDFFPNSDLIGCDIDSRILFNEDRIRTFAVDQTDIKSFPIEIGDTPSFDLMIDDGLHAPHANVSALLYFLPRLKVGGFAIVEDIGQHAKIFWVLVYLLLRDRFDCRLFQSPSSGALAFIARRSW